MSTPLPGLKSPYASGEARPAPHSCEYIQEITRHFNIAALASRLPNSEAQYIQDVLGAGCSPIQQVRKHLVLNRLCNRICNAPACGDKSDVYALRYCGACEMTWYCSPACQLADWPVHQQWCCQLDGPRDTGFLAVALMSK